MLTVVDVHVGPYIFTSTNHTSLSSFQTDLDEQGDLLRICVLDGLIDQGPGSDAVDCGRGNNVCLHISYREFK